MADIALISHLLYSVGLDSCFNKIKEPNMHTTPPETKHYQVVEVEAPVKYRKNSWYLGSRDGLVTKVKCLRGGLATNKDEPPVFLPPSASMAFELKLFDWLMDIPA